MAEHIILLLLSLSAETGNSSWTSYNIFFKILRYTHRNKKCKEVATEEFLKSRLVLLLEIERPHSKSHVFSKQSVFYFIKLSALFFSPLMLYFIFYPSLLFLPACLGRFLYVMSSIFWLFFGRCMVSSVAPSLLFIFRWVYFFWENCNV